MVVATLLGTLKDVVGYIFTNDKWVGSFLWGFVTVLGNTICPGAAQRLGSGFAAVPGDASEPQCPEPKLCCFP